MTRSALLLLVVLAATSASECEEECVVADLSHWNADVDLKVFRAAGIQGVIHKATQGSTYTDPEFAQRASAAAAAGVLWGAYHFGDSSPGDVQARHFLSVVVDWHRTLLALDWEPYSSQMNLTVAEDFVNTVLGLTGRVPFLYGSRSFLEEKKVDDESILARCPLWIAEWADQTRTPAPWKNWTLWQYSDGVHGPTPRNVPGYNGHVDRDRFNSAVQPSLQHMWFSRPV